VGGCAQKHIRTYVIRRLGQGERALFTVVWAKTANRRSKPVLLDSEMFHFEVLSDCRVEFFSSFIQYPSS
jgi:hypothetical protein